MKKQYIHPDTHIQSVRYSCVLCSSDPTPPESEFTGGTSSGDAGGARAPKRDVF